MNADILLPAVAAWLATYLIHSTVLLATTAVVTTKVRGEAWRDTLWKFALVGGVVSATIQVAFDLKPAAGQIPVANASAARTAKPVESAPPSSAVREDNLILPEASAGQASVSENAQQTDRTTDDAAAAPGRDREWLTPSALSSPNLMRNLAIVWAAIAGLLLLRLAYRHVRLFRMLSDRRQVVEGGLAEMLAELRRNAGIWRPVWLAASSRCPTPLALGASEICIPERFVGELQRDEQRAALAHELAHIARRDPLWHLIAGVIECVLFFQPLNRLARLRMRDAAEHLCDDWAIDNGGSQMGLARCLAAVASWIAPGTQPIPNGTMAMAEGGSPLLVRVQRLLKGGQRGRTTPLATRALASALVLAMLVASAPTVVTGAAAEPGLNANAVPSGDMLTQGAPWEAQHEDATIGQASAAQLTSRGPSVKLPIESVTVIRLDAETKRSAISLPSAWKWAREKAALRNDRSYWIAWAVPSMMARGESTLSDSRGFNLDELNLPSIERVLGVKEDADRVRGEGSAAVVLFKLRVPSATDIMRVEQITVRASTVGMRFGAPVYWLGTPDVSSSRRYLEDLIPGIGRSELPRAIVAAIAVHRDEGVVSWLNAVIDDPRLQHLHTEAIEGLGWHPSSATLARLVDLARNAPDADMRHTAVESVGRIGFPGAAKALRELMQEVQDPRLRREVAESMGDRPDSSTLRALMDAAITDPDNTVRRQAAEAIARLHPRDAITGLGQIIWNSDDWSVQVEAVESLGDVGTRDAFELLLKIIQEHQHPRVVVEAVETLGSLPHNWASPALIQVSRRHPSAAVRAKAMEALASLERRKGEDRDMNADPDPGPGNMNMSNLKSLTKAPSTKTSAKAAPPILHR